MVKKLLRYLAYFFIALIIAITTLPFVFKDKIIVYVTNAINDQLNAEVSFGEIDISIWKSFPDMRLSIDSLSVVGIDTFDRLPLYFADRTSIDLTIPSLLGDKPQPKIKEVILDKPLIQIVFLANGMANFDISKSTDTTKINYFIAVQKYQINQGHIKYVDRGSNMEAELKQVDHTGKGDFTQDVFDLVTTTQADTCTIIMDDVKYLNNARINADVVMNLDLLKSSYKFSNGKIKINELDLTGNGLIKLDGDNIAIKSDFKSASESFKSFLSLVPYAYTKDFKDVKASGKATVAGNIDGIYNGKKGVLPAFDIKVKIDNGQFQYPSLPVAVSNVSADIHTKASRSDYKDLFVDIPSFKMNLGKDFLSGKLFVSNLSGDQKLDGFIKSNIDLANLVKAFPIEDIEQLSGKMISDLSFKGSMSDIVASALDKVTFDGQADISGLVYKSKGMPLVKGERIIAKASPAILDVDASNLVFGKSDASVKATIKNPLTFFSTQVSPQIVMVGNSNLVDLNEWQSNQTPTTTAVQPPSGVDNKITQNSNFDIKYKANKVIYDKHEIDQLAVDGQLNDNSLTINNMGCNIEKSDVSINGKVNHIYSYLFDNGILEGDINLKSTNFDANQFMSTQENQTTTTPTEIIPVPERVRVNIHTQIDKLAYTNIDMRDTKGDIVVYDQEAKLVGMTTQMLGGRIGVDGLYNTRVIGSPDFQVKMDLAKISFVQAFAQLETFKKLMPIAQFINGHFNTTLVMNGKLGSNMTPQLSTIDASGFLETIAGAIKGYKPLSDVAEKLGVTQLKEIDFTNTKNWFEIVKGAVDLKEYKRNFDGIDMTLVGKHQFEKGMDFNFDFIIPKEKVKQSKIGKAAVSGYDYLHAEAGKYGINIDNGPNYFVNVKLTGNLLSPNIKITPKTSAGTSVVDAAKNKVNETVNTVKDTVRKEIKKKEEQLKDTITKRANQELEKAKAKAQDAIDRTVDSIKNKAKDKVISKIDTLTKGVLSDSLKQKAKDVLEKNAGKEVDKIKDKIKDFNPFKKGKSGG